MHPLMLLCVLLTATLAASPNLDRAAALSAQLRTIHLDDPMDTELPAGTGARITALRDALRQIAAAHLEDPAELETVLHGSGLLRTDDASLGDVGDLRVERVPGWPGLRVVRIAVGIGVGWDEEVDVYERQGVRWKLALASASPSPSGAREARETVVWRISPPDAKGRWFFATAWGIPWPTSCWNAVHLEVLRPGGDGEHPVHLGSFDASDYRCTEDAFSLSATANSLELGFEGDDRLNLDALMRRHREHFTVGVDRLVPGAPGADDAEGFVDAWSGIDWSRAQRVSDAALEPTHRALAALREQSTPLETRVQPCGDGAVVHVSADDGPEFSVRVRRESGVWHASAAEPDDCE